MRCTDFTTVMNYNYKEAIERYGEPDGSATIEWPNDLVGNRRPLMYLYSFEEMKKRKIILKEATWQPDTFNIYTIWYEVRDTASVPVAKCFYNVDMYF